MITTIQQVLHPLLTLCFIMGLDFFPQKQWKNRWIVNLSILYSLTILFAYVYAVYCVITSFTVKEAISTLDRIDLGINIFTSFVSTIMCRYHQKKFAIFLKKLGLVDDTLEELGVPKMYQKMHMWLKRVIIGWHIYCFITTFGDILIVIKDFKNCFVLTLNHSFYINTLVDLLYISGVWYMGTRFDKVNEQMRYLLREDYGLRCTWKKPVFHRYTLYTDNYKRILWILMHVHLELCHLVRELNLIFGIQLIFEMTSCFLYLVGLFNYVCWIVINGFKVDDRQYAIYYLFRFTIWILSFLLKFYIVNYICENISFKANQTSKIIHELSSSLRYANVWKEIYQFSLQTTYYKVKCTVLGFLEFGNSFLRKLCMSVVSFIIIMRQMEIM